MLLIKCEQDEVIYPHETEWLADDGKDFKSSIMYDKDLAGVKHLYDNGLIHFCSADVRHVSISQQ